MKTIDIKEKRCSIDYLLVLAKLEPVLIHGLDGNDFLLEEADEFEREVATLGSSKNFMAFLDQRSKEKEGVPISKVAQRLGINSI